MSIFDKYQSNFKTFDRLIDEAVKEHQGLKVVIPCYNEPDVITSLRSLYACEKPKEHTEIILVINSGENASSEVLAQNQKSYDDAIALKNQMDNDKITLLVVMVKDLPYKFAGVGYARKIGMDEALRRFCDTNQEDGVIVNFDADSTCNKEYLVELEKLFKNPKVKACSIYYEHPLDQQNSKAIIDYELYLRYYPLSCRWAGFPYGYHTIGSAFAIRANNYALHGGMNRRKAGEDFYFLHKIIPDGGYFEHNKSKVYPSDRKSDRVPFGTGASIINITAQDKELDVYNPESFFILKDFFSHIEDFFLGKKVELQKDLKEFLDSYKFETILKNIKDNSANFSTYKKRFFTFFDAFILLKFLNFIHQDRMSKIPISLASSIMAKHIGIKCDSLDAKELLKCYRKWELGQ